MFQSLGVTLLALASTITYVSACSCHPWTVESRFCVDFAGVFQILDNTTTVGNDTVFDVEIREIYRTIPVKNLDETRLYTPTVSAACGVKMMKDAFYIISGYYTVIPGQQTRMRTGRCAFQKLYDPTFMPPECDEPEQDFQEGDIEP